MVDPLPEREARRIVVLGGGFAGTAAAVELARAVGGESGVEVLLVSEENYAVFQPMLPEVVAGGIEPTHIVTSLRQLGGGVRFRCARVHAIDWARRRVQLAEAESPRLHELGYDQLVLALGQVVDLSRIPGMAEHALPIKTLGDAFHLRNHVLSRLEQAELEDDAARRRWLLTFVAIGGGFSGVETAAEVHDLVRRALPSYPRARSTGHRMVLVHSRDVILNELDPRLGAFAQRTMAARGIEFALPRRSAEATPEGVRLDDGTFIAAGTVICTIGNAPHPLLRSSPLPQQGGRVVTDACLRVEGHDGIWALGDAAAVPDVVNGGTCPPTAQYAVRQGRTLARNVVASLRGEPCRPFAFGGLGQLAVVGHRCGVAQLCGLRLSGFLAWALWRGVYWAKLPSFRSKVRVGLDWLLELFFPRDLAKFEVRRTEALSTSHWRAGDCLVREGERGDTFFVLQKGQVEIVRADAAAPGGERRLAVKGPGESFGETALLTDAPRNATVRALTSVDVLTFRRADFERLVASYGVLREQMERDVARHAVEPAAAPAAPPASR